MSEVDSNLAFVRRHARRLLRDARSDSLVASLPAIRMLHRCGVCRPQQSVAQIHRERHRVQLKHVLRAVAIELGFPDWERCRAQIDDLPASALDRYRLDLPGGGYPNLWFSSEVQARQWQRSHGGDVRRYGPQAVVLNSSS